MTAKITKLWRGVKVVRLEQLPLTDVGLVFNDQSNKLAHSPHVNLLQGLIPLSGHDECVCSYLSGVSVSCLPVHWLCLCLTCHRVCLARQILGVCVSAQAELLTVAWPSVGSVQVSGAGDL